MVLASQTAMTNVRSSAAGQAPASLLAATVPQYVFALAALLFVAAAYFLPRLLMGSVRKQLASQGEEPTFRQITDKVLIIWILRWAMIEAVTMMGFAASMMYADPAAIYPFAAVSLIGFALTVPSEQKVRSGLLES